MVRLVGIDLAWTAHRESGFAVVDGDADGWRLVALDAEVLTIGALAHLCGGPNVVAAIDAPLVVGAERNAERLVGRAFGRYKAGALPAAAAVASGMNAGPKLCRELLALGFDANPCARARPARWALEVYPHTCHVSWFGLPERIKYKRKKGRRVADVRRGLAELQGHLTTALRGDLPGIAGNLCVAGLLAADLEFVRGVALKRLEDQLDAFTCVLAAFYAWRDGVAPCEVFGDGEQGYIAVPGLRRDSRAQLHAVGCVHPHQAEHAR